jgi:hypothetical protein
MIRYARIYVREPDFEQAATRIEAYLPDNYLVIGEADWEGDQDAYAGHYIVIAGRDTAGWTLDGYVIPRLGSGLISAVEIGLGHPIMKQIPDDRPVTVPRTAALLELPYSEVCMHMRVAGKEMWVAPVGDLMAQLYDLQGQRFSIPITRGEAGLRHEH